MISSIFADTSALVKFYYPETDSDMIEKVLLEAEHIFISSLTIVEMASALWRKVRTGELETDRQALLWNAFLDDLETDKMEMLPLDDRHYVKAADLIKEFGGKYGIKTLDSLHLATAHDLGDTMFLCSDKTLSEVARKMGIKVRSAGQL